MTFSISFSQAEKDQLDAIADIVDPHERLRARQQWLEDWAGRNNCVAERPAKEEGDKP